MNNVKFLKKNFKGKTQYNRLGMFEKFSIYIKARLDARNSLPKLEQDVWVSPFLWGKFKEYDHFVSESNVGFGNAIKKSMTEATVLLADAQETRCKLNKEIEAFDLLKIDVTTRRFGEDYLSDEQVRTRRVAELRQLGHNLEAVRSKLHKQTLELIEKKNHVIELAMLVTKNVENFKTATLLRVNFYFDIVIRYHPEAVKLPTTQEFDKYMSKTFIPFEPEQELLLQAVDQFINNTENVKKEV